MAREIVVHLSDGKQLTVSKDREHELRTAIEKRASSVTLRDSNGEHIVNTSHIVRVELKP